MNCLAFPKMFNANSTLIKKGRDATNECVDLLLSTEKGEMFGDPYIGIRIKKYIFEQNNYILRDIEIDEIYEQINTFIPQVSVRRSDINIEQQGNKLYCHIKATNRADFTPTTYDLVLYNGEE